ncbi:MAG TPA: DUF2924 domain-containing protein [Alphaproteobacteria bacterium]|jgi:hypothetical protein
MDISMLADLPRAHLVTRWQTLYGAPPPKGMSQRLMIGALAYAQQAKQQGGASATLSRRLAKLIAGTPISEAPAPRVLKSGARLVREWNGKTHTVEAVENGFIWKGTHFRSLSAVARAITGARWSGPRFFGIDT